MTTVADGTAPGALDHVAGEPGAIEIELRPAGQNVARERGPARSPAAVRYEQFRTVEPEAACRFFAGAYTPGWRVTGSTSRSAVLHRRCATGSVVLDEVSAEGQLVFEIPPADTVFVIQPRAGSLTVTGGPFPHVDWPILVAHGMSCALRVNDARFDVVTIAPEALHTAAEGWRAPPSRQIRFLNWQPRPPDAVRAWNRALDYATATLAAPDTARQPLIAAAIGPLLAGALLECYPSSVSEPHSAGDPGLPETLRDAVAFIHRHAAGEVSINDIAAAVHLTPRAVQYLFRRQLDTTPTEYLRRVRLQRAHDDLITGEPPNGTVSEIARRWGFTHTGRFAALYRRTYGQSPHATLKGAT